MSFFEDAVVKNNIDMKDKAALSEMIDDKNNYFEVMNMIEYYFLHLKPSAFGGQEELLVEA